MRSTSETGLNSLAGTAIKRVFQVILMTVSMALMASCGAGDDGAATPTLRLFSGSLEGRGNVDGTGSAARFDRVYGIAADSTGHVYVADNGNHVIRKISPAGVVTTLAGKAGVAGSADGLGATARFSQLAGLAIDAAGNLYAGDAYTVRKITSAGLVTTMAGSPGAFGDADGPGAVARFRWPAGVAVDRVGNVYVADGASHVIRKITAQGVVTTLAGTPDAYGSADGTASEARFSDPHGLVTDIDGNVYVADGSNCIIRKITPAGVVTTLAGTARVCDSADGTGARAGFSSPMGIAMDAAGSLYVADSFAYTIRKLTGGDVVTTLAGSRGVAGSADGLGDAASFRYPYGVATDGAGNVYVSDVFNHSIRKLTPDGVVTTLAGAPSLVGDVDGMGASARFDTPSGIAAVNASVYVADTYNHIIRKITSAGDVSTLAGRARPGAPDEETAQTSLAWPYAVASDGAGNVYVADTSNHVIRKVSSAGVVTTLAGTLGGAGSADGTGAQARFLHPRGIAVDRSGNVYVADTFNHTVRKVTAAGVVTTLAGTAEVPGMADGAGTAAGFRYPYGIAVDGAGNVYVADTYNHVIRKINPAGEVVTLAGQPGYPGSDDGAGAAGRFDFPQGLTIDNVGNLYVGDTNNHLIRRMTSAGVVTTLVGTRGRAGFTAGALPGEISYPVAVAFDGGSLYIAFSNGIAVVNNLPD